VQDKLRQRMESADMGIPFVLQNLKRIAEIEKNDTALDALDRLAVFLGMHIESPKSWMH